MFIEFDELIEFIESFVASDVVALSSNARLNSVRSDLSVARS